MKKRKSAPEMLGKVVPPMRAYDYFLGESGAPFKAGTAAFSLENSWHLAEAALIAYEEPNFIRNAYLLRGFEGLRFFANPPTEAFVAWKGKAAIVSFRGTELKSMRTFLDLSADASFTKAEFLGGQVHKGFRDGVLAVWEGPDSPGDWAPWASDRGMAAFLGALARENPRMSFYFTGHSLGAALATIGAALFPRATALYTYGSPMVGDGDFAKNLTIPHYRWVNNRDAVTFLPPPELMAKVLKYSYAHSGQEKFIGPDGRLAPPPRDRTFASLMAGDIDRVKGSFSKALGAIATRFSRGASPEGGADAAGEGSFLDAFNDHAPVRYAVNIWNMMCR